MLRHTYGRELVASGIDLATVADLMGHNDVNTTKRYANPSMSDLEQAVEKYLIVRMNEMKQHGNLDEKLLFILSSEELKLVNARYKLTRIGFAALLKYFQLFHQFPTKKSNSI